MPNSYETIAAEIDPHEVGSRTRSAALLAWFLETVWRIDPEIVADSICDGPGDKGIDGIVVDDDLSEIAVLQSKHRDSQNATQGDTDLKNLVGVAPYFASADGIAQLLASGPNAELRNLVKRLKLSELLAENDYRVRLVFVTNGPADVSATDYVATLEGHEPPLEFWDREPLAAVAGRTQHPGLLADHVTLEAESDVIVEELDDQTQIAIALVPASELVQKVPGIVDLTVFDLNVRLGLGNTRINRELGDTVETAEDHPLFPAYHNGLTLLTHGLGIGERTLDLDGISVVNGCQSLLALFKKQEFLTPELRVLVKVVEVGDNHGLESVITYRSNNQNPVNIRDQRSTHTFQLDLQKHVSDEYGGVMFYAIREGENAPAGAQILDNRLAAQLLTAMWLNEPWAAVRKVRLFDADYHRVFARYVDAHKLRLAYLINQLITERRTALGPELEASFASARFTIAFLVAQVVRQTPLGGRLFDEPSAWLPGQESALVEELVPYVEQVIDTVNVYVEASKDEATEEEPFDPKVVFKSASGVRSLEAQVIQSHRLFTRQVERRGEEHGFALAPDH